MAKPGKKFDNLSILSDIYHEQPTSGYSSPGKKDSFITKVKKYFNDPKTVEKWLSGAVLFFGILGLIFGFSHFKNQIIAPFLRPETNSNFSLQSAINEDKDLLGLRQKDTDQDGLSDYDELYLYATSPYLEDSDSDGLDDQKEIARGSDPNCPQGQDCVAFYQELEAEALSPDSNISPTKLRQLLIQAGVPAESLANISDEELMQVYLNTVATGGTSEKEPTVSVPVNDIKQLTPAQVRQLLKEQGVAQAALDQISDQELMELVGETLQEF